MKIAIVICAVVIVLALVWWLLLGLGKAMGGGSDQ